MKQMYNGQRKVNMENIQLLFKHNGQDAAFRKITFKGKCALFECKSQSVSYKTLNSIFGFISSLMKYQMRIPILFDFSKSPFNDKLTMMMFECICYALISEYGYPVKVICSARKEIISEGVHSSPLLILNSEKNENQERFCKKFREEGYLRHFRKIVPVSVVNGSGLSFLMQDIESFLKFMSVKESYRKELSEVISELIGNAGEHGKTECLIDIDVTEHYLSHKKEGEFRGLNFAMVGFSENLFAQQLEEKIMNLDVQKDNGRYDAVRRAFDTHRAFFSDQYNEHDFFRIAAFQHRISGRLNNSKTGGMGLTKLISSLEDMAEDHKCYMISGGRAVLFRQPLLEFDSDNWIGFNSANSFLEAPPDPGVFENCRIYIPGTAYNLCFVMKEDEGDEDEQ